MERADFLKNIAGAAIAPTLKKDLLDLLDDKTVIVQKMDGKKRVAIDIKAIQFKTGSSKRDPSIREILQLYAETGVLIYQRTPEMEKGYHPITVID